MEVANQLNVLFKFHLIEELGLELDLSDKNFGVRMKRSAFIIDNNKVTHLAVDESAFKDSSAEAILAKL